MSWTGAPPYNISVLNCETAIFALEHESPYAEQAAAIRASANR